MTEAETEVQIIPIAAITVLNPRARNKKIFGELVTSIAHLGLKKPITVGRRSTAEGTAAYDLVCGQGRLEAFIALGQKEIPAIVIDATPEECYIRSLVENLARRNHNPLELVRQIGELRSRGYSIAEVARKIDFSHEYVSAICFLLDHGEERLINAVERGLMPHSLAIEIARAKDSEVQQALIDAYERGILPGKKLLAIRHIIEERNLRGKAMLGRPGVPAAAGRKVSADALVRAYVKEAERQKVVVRKAEITQRRLIFVVNAMRRLLDDENFVTLLRAEGFATIPTPLANRVERKGS
jgi:ParB family chromosome partitioning protein